jgi:hypothetical protein
MKPVNVVFMPCCMTPTRSRMYVCENMCRWIDIITKHAFFPGEDGWNKYVEIHEGIVIVKFNDEWETLTLCFCGRHDVG